MSERVRKKIFQTLSILTIGFVIISFQNCDPPGKKSTQSSQLSSNTSSNTSLEAKIQAINNRISELSAKKSIIDSLQRQVDAADRRISSKERKTDTNASPLYVHRYGVSCGECTLSYGSSEAKKSACHGSHEKTFDTVLRTVVAKDNVGVIYKANGSDSDSCTSLETQALELCSNNSDDSSSCVLASKENQKCLIVCSPE